MKKMLLLAAALLAASLFCLAACGGNDDDGGTTAAVLKPYLPAEFADKTVAAVYTNTQANYQTNIGGAPVTFVSALEAYYFFSDNDFVSTLHTVDTSGTERKGARIKGTYTGSATADGDVTMSHTHMNNVSYSDPADWATITTKETITISGGSFASKQAYYRGSNSSLTFTKQ